MNQQAILSIVVFLLFSLSVSAQKSKAKEDPCYLLSEVYDSFTKIPLKAKVYLMYKDSTVIDSARSSIYQKQSNIFVKLPNEENDYIVKVTSNGYYPLYRNVHFKPSARKKYVALDYFWMKKKNKEFHAELDEVVVKATRVQMYYKGDTIVYDASAFVLPEGSMLDALVRQMPGAELDANGNVSINGKLVDYLTLNGKDFFKGKNKLMLENLPYYTIKDVKVFEKERDDIDKVAKDEGDKKDYVMDISLKREYHHSSLGNAEVGAGTENRWMARFFGLFMGERTTASLFATANNVNEDRKPGQDGTWKPSSMKKSIKTSKQVGFNMQTDDANKKWTNNLEITSQWSKDDMESKSFSETFASEGNILSGGKSVSLDKDYSFNLHNRFYVKTKGSVNLSLSYNTSKSWSSSKDSTYRDALINMSENLGLSKYKTFSSNLSVNRNFNLPTGDRLSIYASGYYTSSKPNDNFRQDKTFIAQSASRDVRNQYTDRQSRVYNYSVGMNYEMRISKKLTLTPNLNYSQYYNSRYNSNYRLDRLEDGTFDELGILPSDESLMMEAFDPNNSSTSHNMNRTYSASLDVNYHWNGGYVYFDVPGYRIEKEKMHYIHNALDTIACRSKAKFAPYLRLDTWGKNKLSIEYRVNTWQPTFSSLMPYVSDNNVLAIHVNNPNQKARTDHTLRVEKKWKADSTDLNVWVNLDAKFTRNAFGSRTSYNSETGAYTYMNDNVNGNWNTNLKAGLTRSLDKRRRLRLDIDGSVKYTHSVDFDIAYHDEETRLSHVNTWNPSLNVKLRYRLNDFTVGINGKSVARFSRGDRANFEKINAYDFQYGGNLQYTIPVVKFTLSTDINMFSRRGYNSSMMNTDDLVWNAQLTRPLFKGMLIAKLQAFDLLHQLTNKNFYVDAQGRTETWYNTIPRYMMFSLAVKMHKKNK